MLPTTYWGEPETTIDSENGNGTPNTVRCGGDEGHPNPSSDKVSQDP